MSFLSRRCLVGFPRSNLATLIHGVSPFLESTVGDGASPCWRRSLVSLGLGLFLISFGVAMVVRGAGFSGGGVAGLTDPLIRSGVGGELVLGIRTHIGVDDLDYSFRCGFLYSLSKLWGGGGFMAAYGIGSWWPSAFKVPKYGGSAPMVAFFGMVFIVESGTVVWQIEGGGYAIYVFAAVVFVGPKVLFLVLSFYF